MKNPFYKGAHVVCKTHQKWIRSGVVDRIDTREQCMRLNAAGIRHCDLLMLGMAGPSIELVYDPELIKRATDNVKLIDLTDADYVLLSEEDVEKEISVETD